jgi:hypothetical protein
MLDSTDIVVVATDTTVDFNKRGSEPYHTDIRILYEGQLSST